ncbi:MAG: hypothetical protein WBG86_16255, partial [Polyangiales bacterium]
GQDCDHPDGPTTLHTGTIPPLGHLGPIDDFGVAVLGPIDTFAEMKQALIPIALLSAALFFGCGDDSSGGGGGGAETCADCVGTPTGPENAPDPAVSCEPSEEPFACICNTQSGSIATVFLSGAGCQ